MSSRDMTMEQWELQTTRRRIKAVDARLRELATDVELKLRDIEKIESGQASTLMTYGSVAGDLVQDINSALMNLSLGGVVTSTALADVFRAEESAATPPDAVEKEEA